MDWSPSNEVIEKTLRETFKLPVYYAFNEHIEDYHYFVYMPIKTRMDTKCVWYQEVAVVYVSINDTNLREDEIYRCLSSINLKPTDDIEYNRVPLSDKSTFADIVSFKCQRRARFM